jgi:hypothetical protein
MGILEWLFDTNETIKNDRIRKKVFISFAIEDIEYRDYLVSQARLKHSPFDFIDMSVKKEWILDEWKDRCRTKIRKCDGMIALISKNTHKAGGARWEIKCAREEGLKIIGMHIKKKDKGAIPIELKGKKVIIWSWVNLEIFINKL